MVCDILPLICGLYIYIFTWKSKKQKKKIFRVASPSVWAAALGEEGFFPECCTRGRIFFLKKEGNDADWSPTASILPRVLAQLSEKPSPSARFLALGEDVFPVKRYPGQSSPSVALGEGFPECIWH